MRSACSHGRSATGVRPSFAPANSRVWKYSSGWWKPSLWKAARPIRTALEASQRLTKRRHSPPGIAISARSVVGHRAQQPMPDVDADGDACAVASRKRDGAERRDALEIRRVGHHRLGPGASPRHEEHVAAYHGLLAPDELEASRVVADGADRHSRTEGVGELGGVR